MLPVPEPENLSVKYSWSDSNEKRIILAAYFMKESDELMRLLDAKKAVASNKYNMEVIRTVALLCRQNLMMLADIKQIDGLLQAASASSGSDHRKALYLMDQALDISSLIKIERNKILDSTIKVWYKDWLPLVSEANGRKYLHAVDDVKDHRPIRTPDMSYLIYRQLRFGVDKWAQETVKARNRFAAAHNLEQRSFTLNWNDPLTRSLP
jgi:hypothetical protein